MTPNRVILFLFITLLTTSRVYSSRQSKIEINSNHHRDESSEGDELSEGDISTESKSENEEFLEVSFS